MTEEIIIPGNIIIPNTTNEVSIDNFTTLEEAQTKKEEDTKTDAWHEFNENILEQIYTDPQAILQDEQLLLEHIVNNGNNAAALCEALGLEELTLNIQGQTYNMALCNNPFGLSHYDMLFHPEKATKARLQERQMINPIIDNSLKPDKISKI